MPLSVIAHSCERLISGFKYAYSDNGQMGDGMAYQELGNINTVTGSRSV